MCLSEGVLGVGGGVVVEWNGRGRAWLVMHVYRTHRDGRCGVVVKVVR